MTTDPAAAQATGQTLPIYGRDTGQIPRTGEIFAPGMARALNGIDPALGLSTEGQPLGPGLADMLAARVGGDDKPERHRQAKAGHFAQVGPLAPEQGAVFLTAFIEQVNTFCHGASSGLLSLGWPRRV